MTRRQTELVLALSGLVLAGCRTPEVVQSADIVLAESGAGNPTVTIDRRSGAALAAWIETHDSAGDVYVAALGTTGRLEAVRANDIAGDATPHDQAPPQVASAPDGAVYVLWQNTTHVPGRPFPASNLRFARSTDGGRSFEPAIFVNDDAAGMPSSHTFQDIAVAADGTIYVSWIDGRARSAADAAAASHGDHGEGRPGSEVRVTKSTDGGRTFTPGVIVHRDVCPCCRTSVAVGADGAVAVAFRSAEQDIRDIVVVRSMDAGATFSDPVRVHADEWEFDSCPHAGASLAYGADGRLHVAWYTGAEERQGLWYAASAPDATSFESPIPLQTGGWVPVSQVKLAVADNGDVWIAWDDRREKESTIRVAAMGAVRCVPCRCRSTVDRRPSPRGTRS